VSAHSALLLQKAVTEKVAAGPIHLMTSMVWYPGGRGIRLTTSDLVTMPVHGNRLTCVTPPAGTPNTVNLIVVTSRPEGVAQAIGTAGQVV
jgi:hypothetical protein